MAARGGGNVTTLGHIVHNPQMVQSFEEKGLVNAHSVDDVESGTLFVRAHGLPVEVFEKAEKKGLTIVDATCPMVTKIHVQAEKLRADGYKIVVVGDPNHPEGEGNALARSGRMDRPGSLGRRRVAARESRRRRRAIDVVRRRLHGDRPEAQFEILRSSRGQHDLHRHAQPAVRSGSARDAGRSDGRRRRQDVCEHEAPRRSRGDARRAFVSHRGRGGTRTASGSTALRWPVSCPALRRRAGSSTRSKRAWRS